PKRLLIASRLRTMSPVILEPSLRPLSETQHGSGEIAPLPTPYQDDFGSESSTATVNAPDLISSSRVLTLATTSAGTLPSNVPRGDRLQPPNFMDEYWP